MTKALKEGAPKRKASRNLLWLLCLAAMAMFGFGFALVPLYNVMCRTLNINGKYYQGKVGSDWVDDSRDVHVQFITNNNANMPWVFKSKRFEITVHPGENKRVDFYAKNTTDHGMTVQAIPSITPHEAAPYLRKTECFCFTQQYLDAHAAREMPVIFHLDPSLPKHIDTVTLSYTLFDISNRPADKATGRITPGRLAS